MASGPRKYKSISYGKQYFFEHSSELMATFSTVHSDRFGGTSATSSSELRVVPSNMAVTRNSVGGTTGSPSVHPRSNIASCSSSRAASSTRRDLSMEPPNLDRNSSTRPGSTVKEPQPGLKAGRDCPRLFCPDSSCHACRSHPVARPTSAPFSKRTRVGTT